ITAGATNSPAVARLPFVGPNPIDPSGPDSTPPVSFAFGAGNGSGSFLFDTGAATSMISLAKAASLGVTYSPGTFNTASAALVGVPASSQFRMTVRSLTGTTTLAGFYLSSLTVQTTNASNVSEPIQFTSVPVLVGDVALGSTPDPNHVTLDGVL